MVWRPQRSVDRSLVANRWEYRGGRIQAIVFLLLSAFVGVAVLCGAQDTHDAARRALSEVEGETTASFSYFPTVFTEEELKSGACVLHLMGTFYMFLALAIVCDAFFVPALEQISDTLDLSPDVAGATFMAAGGSAPELFTSFFGYNFASEPSTVGLGTIIGSAVFNVLFVIGICALVSPVTLKLTMWPLARDCTFYIVDLLFLTFFFLNGQVSWPESLCMFLLYLCYANFMMHSERAERYFEAEIRPRIRAATSRSATQRVNVLPSAKDLTSERSIAAGSQVTDSAYLRRHSADAPRPECEDGTGVTNGVSGDGTGSIGAVSITSHDSKADSSTKGAVVARDTSKFSPAATKFDTDCVDPEWKERTQQTQRPLIRRVQSLPVGDTCRGKVGNAWAEADLNDRDSETSSKTRVRGYGSRKSVSGGGMLNLTRSSSHATCSTRHVNGAEVNTQSGLRARIMTNMYRTGRRKSTLISVDAGSKTMSYAHALHDGPKLPVTGEEPDEMVQESLGNVMEENEEEEDEDEALEIRCPTSDEGFMDWVKFLVTLPIIVVLAYTIPDVRRPERQKWFLLSFFLSVCWIASFTLLMLVWSTTFARTIGIPEHLLGLTILAAGTSVPDLITSVIVSKQGHGDMAISSSIGSNIFDVTVGLPIPWMLYHARTGLHVPIRTRNANFMWIQAATLMGMVTLLVLSVKLCRWQMSKKLGILLLFAYVIFLGQSIWMEFLEV